MFYFHKYKKWLVLTTGKYSLCVIRLNFVAKKTCFSGLFKCTHYSNQKITNKKVKSCDMHDLLIDIKNNVRRCKICFFLLAASDIAICHLFYQQKSWFDITIAVSSNIMLSDTNFVPDKFQLFRKVANNEFL